MGILIPKLCTELGIWSREAVFNKEVHIENTLWIAAEKWAKTRDGSELSLQTWFPLTANAVLPPLPFKKWKSFQDYKDSLTVGLLSTKGDDWREFDCSCYDFHKKWVCCHVVGAAICQGLLSVPASLKALVIEDKPKRGTSKEVARNVNIQNKLE